MGICLNARSAAKHSSGKNTLQQQRKQNFGVVIKKSPSDGMNMQAQIIAQRMEETYPELIVQLDILPNGPRNGKWY